MLRLRQYKGCDAKSIISWIFDEQSYIKWSVGKFGDFPISAEDINRYYLEKNGGCEEDNFFPFTAFDEDGIVGSMIMRFVEGKEVLRFGFIIVDNSKRGKGYGKEMLSLALKYAFQILRVKKVTIGVFANNPSAVNCYKSVGFKEVGEEVYNFYGESWKCIELELENF